ncbi:MAG: hypothetical protein AAFO68_09765, partial [Pseudomonadota bacterium]
MTLVEWQALGVPSMDAFAELAYELQPAGLRLVKRPVLGCPQFIERNADVRLLSLLLTRWELCFASNQRFSSLLLGLQIGFVRFCRAR